MPVESPSGFTPAIELKVELMSSKTSCKEAFKFVMEKVLPEIVNVPSEISENKAKSLSDDERFIPPASFPKFLFLELISVLLASDSTFTSNSPVNAPAFALAVNPSEEEGEIPTDLALKRFSSCKDAADDLSVFKRLFRTPNSEIFA